MTAIFDRRRLQSHVRIWRGDTPVGSGFVVGPRHVMTCAHVVADAFTGQRGPLRGCMVPPTWLVRMDMPVAPGRFFAGRVIPATWRPAIGQECDEVDDVAVLELCEGDLPRLAVPVGKARSVREDDWIVGYGVAPKLSGGVIIRGSFRGSIHNRFLIQAEAVDEAVRPGCSGAAAWNSSQGGLAGMIAEMQQTQTGRVIPVDLLDGVWPIEWEDRLRTDAALPPEPSEAALELEGLNRLASAPATRRFVLLYGGDIRRTSACANMIGALKQLHDLVDQLRRTVYAPLRSIAARLPAPDAFLDLVRHRGLFLDLRGKIAATASGFEQDAFPWIDEQLACAADDLKEAIAERRAALVESANENLRQIAEAELTSLDSRIADATRQLDLAALVLKLEALQVELEASGLGVERLAALAGDIATLTQIEARVDALIRLHHNWQRIDAYLNALENALGQSVETVATVWRNLARRIDKSANGAAGEEISGTPAATAAMAAAIESGDATGIWIAFPDLATCLRDRFFAIDRDLLAECERVRTVGASLSAVVDKLDGYP